MLADVSLFLIVLCALIFLLLVYCSNVLREAPYRYRHAIGWFSHSRSVAIIIYCLWSGSREFVKSFLYLFLIIGM